MDLMCRFKFGIEEPIHHGCTSFKHIVVVEMPF